ncbi:hypothetical protein AKG34_08955 [Peribacillus butanolivorans]|uniref:hypothetical protein n=1 Tax=Peribacillus butanolivorans TaxID=421767 RepID=UPI0006A6ABF2|nr:hypothetical protein [Peribacillus butanolivorans]KON68900.1 hypothetical protein AKG34_08955 [Peribacillus butanolivorans]
MNFQKILNGCLVLFLVLNVSACGSDGVKGNGKTTELSLEEAEKFETGFLYVRSPFESRKEEEDFKIKEIERVAKAKNIDLNIYHAKEDTSKLGLKQNSLTFAFYQDGEVKKKLDFIDLSEDDIHFEVATFVQSVQQEYLK